MIKKVIRWLFGLGAVALKKSEKKELRKLEREAYLTKSRALVKERGEKKARDDFEY